MTQKVSLGARLQHINQITLVVALGLVAVIIVISSFLMNLFNLIHTSQMQARVLAENSAASLMFKDGRSAEEMLRSLHHSPDVLSAGLYANDSVRLASFVRSEFAAPALAAQDLTMHLDHFVLTEPALFNGTGAGHLAMAVQLGGLYLQTAWQLLVTILAAGLGLAASSLLLRRLNAGVLAPLAELNQLGAEWQVTPTTVNTPRPVTLRSWTCKPEASTPCSNRSRSAKRGWRSSATTWKTKSGTVLLTCRRPRKWPRRRTGPRVNFWPP